MSQSTVARLRRRLLAVEWPDNSEETASRAILTGEFVRRLSAWALLPGEPVEGWPFFDAAGRVDPAVRAPEDVVTEVTAAVPSYQPHVRRACEAALHVAALADAQGIPEALLEPYAPLVRSFELGGGFVRDCSGVFFDIGLCGMRFHDAGFYAGKPASSGLPEFPDLAGEQA